ncbi:MAG: hypothetical protein IPK97_08290 [Ahniella sp.]|nr:hypothetical protein [Ahniella sp.]
MNNRFVRAMTAFAALMVFSVGAWAQDVLWRDILQNASETTNARHTALLDNGDIIVGGLNGASSATRDFMVYRIRGSDGVVVWSRRLDGGGTGETVNDLIADPVTGMCISADVRP